jgi:HlyD family secretion protein
MTRPSVAVLLIALAAAGAPIATPALAAEPAPAAAAPSKAPLVTVVAAARRTITESVIVTGTLAAREEVQVSADVDGLKIEEILADEGDTVAAGAVLARLATESIEISVAQNASQLASSEAAIAQARSQIIEAKASATQAATALERTRTLAAKGVASQDLLDQRVAAADAAAARLAVAEQALAAAEANKAVVEATGREWDLRMRKTEVKAPKGGLVLGRTARVGAIVSAQSGALFRIAEDGLIELDAEVTETVLARIAPGQAVSVLAAGAREPVAGEVRLVSPEVNPTTRLGKVRVALPAGAALRVGSFARGTVETARSDGIVLPVSAVQTGSGQSSVQVVRDGKVETRPVKTGLSGDGFVEIVEGLAEGERVVARSGTFLRDGDAVQPAESSNEGANG